ncbi:carcinoembryonic antigen-related cell adhesion molecule 20-like [Gigantopelta aegis]|uniref:carcinoembryonic antigen-related cell adhesion molecule 20-like n=1 Tax=Gigantopelta aegis TaxID=1735272 RepID=UPI001B88AAC7|nr:carcinoembryonic antigen-related cell adhesion molecule 20-like [Gigantopelta aegis]
MACSTNFVTSSCGQILFLLVCLLQARIYRGASIHLSGSSTYVELNQTFVFTCTVKQAANLNDRIVFYRKVNSVMTIRQKMATCYMFSGIPKGYNASCGAGTDSITSVTKNYTIVINKAADIDDENWWCELNDVYKVSNTIFLHVYYGPDPGSIKFNSTIFVEEGHDMTVDCTADCNPPCDYVWALGDNHITTSPLLNLTDLSRNQDGNVYNCTVTNSAVARSISKNYTLEISYDPERMSALSAGVIAGILIAVALALAIPTAWILYKRKIKRKAEDVQNESNN